MDGSVYANVLWVCLLYREEKGGHGNGGRTRRREERKWWGAEQASKFWEMNFQNERKLESLRKVQLGSELGFGPRQVAV